MGRESKSIGDDFEKEIEASFDGYSTAGTAYLDFMPVPTRMVRGPGGKPMRVQDGKAPFDVYGHSPQAFAALNVRGEDLKAKVARVAVFVGAELKASGEAKTALSIVKPGSDSHGLEYHQLDALALLARIGGIARVVWNNGGQVGVLENEQIVLAHAIYDQSLSSEKAGKGKGPLGCRSIPWAQFRPVRYGRVGGRQVIDWLKVVEAA